MSTRKRPGNTPVEQQERNSSTKGDDPKRSMPRPGPDTEAYPGERQPDSELTGSQTGTVGGGGPDAHKPPLKRRETERR